MLDSATSAGISRVELSSYIDHDPEMEASIGSHVAGHEFLIHNYFPPPAEPFVLNLAARDDEVLERSRSFCRNAIRMCASVGAPFYSVHAGFALEMSPEELGHPEAQGAISRERRIPRKEADVTFAESVRELAGCAANHKIRLLIENNVLSPVLYERARTNPFLMVSPGDFKGFIEEMQIDNLGILLDMGHLKVSATALGFRPEEFLEVLGNHIEAFHLNDNDGHRDTHGVFDDTAWFYPYLRQFADVPMIVETTCLSESQASVLRDCLDGVPGS